MKLKPLAIIGLDPGTTTAYAIIDLRAKVIEAFSSKNLALGDVITRITSVCQPIITATDKGKLPSFVEEFSRKLGTRIFVPGEDLSREEKRKMVLAHFPDGSPAKNGHEEDSLASALFAHRKYSQKISKAKQFILENNLGSKEEEFLKIAISEDFNFSQIKNLLTRPMEENKIIQKVVVEEKITKNDFMRLYQKMSEAKNENFLLGVKINQLGKEISCLKKENLVLRKKGLDFDRKIGQMLFFKESRLKTQTQEISSLKNQIGSLSKKIGEADRLISASSRKDLTLLKKLNNLSQEEWNRKKEILNIQENDFLLVKNPNIYSGSVVQMLTEKLVILFSPEKPGRIIRENFAFVPVSGSDIKLETEHFALVSKSLLEQKTEKDFLDRIVNEHKGRG